VAKAARRPANACRLSFPTKPADAEDRADWWESEDPFDDIFPSMLTAEQITNYARVTGLIFQFDEKFLKGATYEVGISGDAFSWNGDGTKNILPVQNSKQNEVILAPNSITFVETDVEFRLPNYIAVRFNLHIKLVHRGLLLGTGPIVDPGFRGKLLIPLHNLTSSPYTIASGEKIVWIEFSKTLFGQTSKKDGYELEKDDFRVFPKNKRWLSAAEYLQKANGGNPIVSSISGFISKTDKKVTSTQNWVRGLGFFAFIGLIFTFGGALYGSWSIYNNALSILNADKDERAKLMVRLERIENCARRDLKSVQERLDCQEGVEFTPPPSATQR